MTSEHQPQPPPETEPPGAENTESRALNAESSPNRSGRPPKAVRRELRSWPTVALVLFCILLGIPATIVLTPDQELTVAGQHLSVGARTPSLSLSGPAQLVQIGNTELDIAPLQVYGPLRPRLTLGPVQRSAAAAAALDPATSKEVGTVARSTIGQGFVRWYAWATLGLLAFTLAATAVAAYVRMLVTLRQQSRALHVPLNVADIWHQSTGQIFGMTIVAVVAAMLAWGAAGVLAYNGAVHGLQNVRSLADLVGTYHLSPSAVGPPVRGYTGAVIGDSRASRVGGPLVAEPSEDDKACARSSDSLAGEIGSQLSTRVLNLACPGASIARGLRGPQVQGGREVPSQIGRLKQVEGLKFVVVVIGPNDLYWADFLRYCYGVTNCQDNLTQGEFNYRLAAFDRDYGDLLQDLNDLPSRPQVIIVESYDVFKPDAKCRDTEGPPEASGGLNPANISLLISRNSELNDVLSSGAKKYTFDVASPVLQTLCQPSHDQLGPDLQGLADSHPFHPTGIGMIRMASSVVRVVKPDAGD